jgi:WW domain
MSSSLWQEFVDDDSGCTYYWNESTGETTWETPSGYASPETRPSPVPSVWIQFTDDDSGCPYWYNEQTGESTWEDPGNAMKDEANAVEAKVVSNVPCTARAVPPVSGSSHFPIVVKFILTCQGNFMFTDRIGPVQHTHGPLQRDRGLISSRRLAIDGQPV